MSQNGLSFDPRSSSGLLAWARRVLVPAPAAPAGAVDMPLTAVQPRLCDQILLFAEQNRWWLFATIIVFYSAAFTGQWRVQPDAALYLSIGRNLATGRGFTYLGKVNRLAYPGWPCLIAGMFRLFGTQSLAAVNALVTLIALLTVAMVYRLVLLHRDRPTAVVVAFGTALTKAFFCFGFELWSDMPFALGVMACLAGFEGAMPVKKATATRSIGQRSLDWFLLVAGLIFAVAMRPTGWPLLIALLAALVVAAVRGRISYGKLSIVFSVAVAVLAVALLATRDLWAHDGFGRGYGHFLKVRLTSTPAATLIGAIGENARALFSWAASDVLFQVRLGAFCNALLSTVVLLLGFGLFRHRSLWGFWFCLLLGTILFSQEALDRYFLPVLPLLVFAWWDALVRLNRMIVSPWNNLVFLLALGFGMVMNVSKVGGIVVQQHLHPFLTYYDKGTYETIPQLVKQIDRQLPADAIILVRSPYGRVTNYLAQRAVVGGWDVPVSAAKTHPVYVIEPADGSVISYLERAHLVEGAEVFSIEPSTGHQPNAMRLVVFATRRQ